jgi:pimeloyl-ACP methyl ester carboxylesterase
VRATLSVIFGERDAFAVPYLAERHEAFRRLAPGLDFRVVPGAGHWVIYEAAETVNRTLGEMLA